ncbi:MAG: YbfB/YjiJ family MFS transporter [Hyphomicrobiales bacterium]|nr:YbfB/YjiJ family MFS transporter [Hyphomicrobiales bacterium]
MKQHPLALPLGGMVAMAAGMGVGRFVYTPILPIMAQQLGLTASQAGLIASANFLGYLAGALLTAIGRFGNYQYRLLIGGLVINIVGLLAMMGTDDFSAHLVIRFAGGVGSAFILVFASALVIERLTASGHGALAAVHFSGVGLGIFISALMVTVMVNAGYDWKALWLMCAVLATFGLFGAIYLIAPVDGPPDISPIAAPKRGNGALKLLIMSYGLFGFSYVITATFIVVIIRDTPETRMMEPYVWMIVGLAVMPSIAFWIFVSKRLGPLLSYAIACLVEAVGVGASVLWDNFIGVFVAAVFLGGTMIGITAIGFMAARTLSSGDQRVNVALMTASFGLGQVAGPTFAGYLADATGSYLIPSLAGCLALLAASAMAFFLHRGSPVRSTRSG